MAAEPSQAEKSPVAVLTQGSSLESGEGDNGAVVVVANEGAKKRQSLSDIFTIVSFSFFMGHGKTRFRFVHLLYKLRSTSYGAQGDGVFLGLCYQITRLLNSVELSSVELLSVIR